MGLGVSANRLVFWGWRKPGTPAQSHILPSIFKYTKKTLTCLYQSTHLSTVFRTSRYPRGGYSGYPSSEYTCISPGRAILQGRIPQVARRSTLTTERSWAGPRAYGRVYGPAHHLRDRHQGGGKRWSSNPSGKCSYERPTRGTVCGTMRGTCGADAGCLATHY